MPPAPRNGASAAAEAAPKPRRRRLQPEQRKAQLLETVDLSGLASLNDR